MHLARYVVTGLSDDQPFRVLDTKMHRKIGEYKTFTGALRKASALNKGETMPSDGREYVGHPCKLDGMNAAIYARLNDAATIGTLRPYPHVSVEFSWPAVARIMANGGEFKS